MFKIGDKIRIKEWKQMLNKFGKDSLFLEHLFIEPDNCYFTNYMKRFCGKTATIVKENSDNVIQNGYIIMFDDINEQQVNNFVFTKSMIKYK